MSSKERDQLNLAQSASQFINIDPIQQEFAIGWVWGFSIRTCRGVLQSWLHSCYRYIGLEAPVSTGFVQSQLSGKGQGKKHLTPWLFLPATSSNSRWEMCSWDNNNQAYQGTNSSQHSQGRCPTNYSPPGQKHFYSINDP